MKFLFQDVEKGFYNWGLEEGYKVAGFNWCSNSIDSCFRGSIPAIKTTRYFKLDNDEVWCFEEIKLMNEKRRVKKATYKVF